MKTASDRVPFETRHRSIARTGDFDSGYGAEYVLAMDGSFSSLFSKLLNAIGGTVSFVRLKFYVDA